MAKFIEIIDVNGDTRLININHISDIFENMIYLDLADTDKQISIRCKHSYEEIKTKLMAAGGEVY